MKRASSLLRFSISLFVIVGLCYNATIAVSAAQVSSAPLCVWKPVQNPRAVAILVHGITAHAQCLEQVAEALTADSVLTYGVDLRGHGWWYQHVPAGFPGHNCDYKASVNDVDSLVRRVKAEHPSLPVFLVGESIGAAVALRSAVHSSDSIDGLVLCAAGNKCGRANPLWIAGDVLRGCTFRKINLLRYQTKYGSEDEVALQAMEHEPGMRSVFSAGELIKTVRFLKKNLKIARALDPRMPVLVIQGSEDLTIRPDSAMRLFASLPNTDKHFVEVPKCGHVLLATPRPKPLVSKSILSFINQESAKAVANSGESSKL